MKLNTTFYNLIKPQLLIKGATMLELRNIIQLLLLGTIVIVLAGCITMATAGKTRATLNIQSVQYLNPNINGQASPVRLTIYQLKSPFNFRETSYQELINNSNKVLGNDLIDKQTIEIRPNLRSSSTISLSNNTEYLGIVAGFREIDSADWQALVEIIPETRNVILVNLESQSLTVRSNTKTSS